ncbi:diguanylate cyclase [Ideonella sp.]|uniref:diguanylate cyclase n=1 Tax=Ideonella sp. TaxID=1929293 RepID=UPI0035B48A26
MSLQGRPKGEHGRAQPDGAPVTRGTLPGEMRRLAAGTLLAVWAALPLPAAAAVQATAAPAGAGAVAAIDAAATVWQALEKLDGALALRQLEDEAARWVRAGYDDPDGALRRLDELQQGVDAGLPLAWTRVLERTRGLVAARAGREAVAQEAAGRLLQMASRDPVAAADAAMVRAELDDQLWRIESAVGHALEADAAYARACTRDPRGSACDHRGWWHAIRLLAVRADRQGNRLEAARMQQRANELAQQADDDTLLAIGLSVQASFSAALNEPEKARREMAQAERHARKSRDGEAMVVVLLHESMLASLWPHGKGERQSLERALALARAMPSARWEAMVLAALSDEYLRAGRPREALAAVERALPVVRRFDDRRRVPVLLHNGGLARLRLGQAALGKADLEAAVRLWEQAQARARIELALNESADALADIGDAAAALDHFHRADRLRREIDDLNREAVLAQLKERFRTEASQRDLELAERENSLKTARLENQTLIQRVWMLASLVLALAAGVLVFQVRRTRQANRQLRHSEALLKVQSERDPLTGLANRRYFREALAARQPGRGEGFHGGLVLLDVDHFKRINDDYGHVAGDAVLVEVARRLEACVRSGDVACRWGGEEFLLHTPSQSPEAVEALALRVLAGIGQQPVRLPDGREIAVTMSMAYAAFPLAPHGVTLPWEQAVNLVDMGLYTAKAMGRDRAVGILAAEVADSAALHAAASDFERAMQQGRITARITARAG